MSLISSSNWQLPDPAGHAPLRPSNSVRRTSSIDMTWPEGRDQPMAFLGRARDVYTGDPDVPPTVLAEDTMTARVERDRTLAAIATTPPRDAVAKLVGLRGGGHLRTALKDILPQERIAGSPLYLLLDDLSGTSLIAGWAWSRWPGYAPELERALRSDPAMRAKMEGVCISFQPGLNAMSEEYGSSDHHRTARVLSLVNPEDPSGWHPLPLETGLSMRRARRIDVWLEGDVVRMDAAFQDSASLPDGGREAVHEYSVTATADLASMTLINVNPRPHVLPYPECPAAVANVGRLTGTPLAELREVVLERLGKTTGCTHLNDALRALAEVPQLLHQLKAGQ